MPGRVIDIVASGPPPHDPYEPAASAWALAAALTAQGNDVQVVHLPATNAAAAPTGVTAVPVTIRLRRPGGPVEPAEFASAAGHHLRRTADVVLRDPVGLAALGAHRTRRGPPVVGAFVRGTELSSFEGYRQAHPETGLVDRVDTWLDRRSVRRLERAALGEADRLFHDDRAAAQELAEMYDVPERKLTAIPAAVASLPPLPPRATARQELRIPTDVPVVVALTAFETPEPSGVDRVLESFRRVRPFFPGVRLVVAGSSAPPDPGVIALPDRTAATFVDALASADVAVFARRAPGFDPGLALAARAGIPPIVLPSAVLPVDPQGGVRVSVSDDPGDLASVLAELLADPAMQKEVGRAAVKFSDAFRPDRVADAVLTSLSPRSS